MSDEEMSDEYVKALEEVAERAASSFGAPQFDRVVEENGNTLLYNGESLVMVIHAPLAKLIGDALTLKK